MPLTSSEILTHGELFAGISGFGLGFAKSGIKTIWHVEIDKHCQKVLRRHYPDGLILDDIRKCGKHNLPQVDIISFGSPCQDLSIAGSRKGLDGERSSLFFEAIRVVAELKPTFAVWENVPGTLSSNSGRDFATVLAAFRECGARDIAWRILDAQYFGLAQRRRRVFVVADFRGERAAEILFERESGAGDTAPGREERKGSTLAITERTRDAGRTLETQDELAYALTDPGSGGCPHSRLIAYGGNNTNGAIDKATAVNAHGSRRYDFESETFAVVRNMNDFGLDCSPALRDSAKGSGSEVLVCNTFNGYTGGADDNDAQGRHLVASVAPTLQKESYSPTKSSTGQQLDWCITQQAGVRRLTPTECERLQGFPDFWTAWGQVSKSKHPLAVELPDGGILEPQSDTQRYRQLGNAVAVPVAEWVGHRIAAAVEAGE